MASQMKPKNQKGVTKPVLVKAPKPERNELFEAVQHTNLKARSISPLLALSATLLVLRKQLHSQILTMEEENALIAKLFRMEIKQFHWLARLYGSQVNRYRSVF